MRDRERGRGRETETERGRARETETERERGRGKESEREKEGKRERQRDQERETGRERKREKERHRDRERGRERQRQRQGEREEVQCKIGSSESQVSPRMGLRKGNIPERRNIFSRNGDGRIIFGTCSLNSSVAVALPSGSTLSSVLRITSMVNVRNTSLMGTCSRW